MSFQRQGFQSDDQGASAAHGGPRPSVQAAQAGRELRHPCQGRPGARLRHPHVWELLATGRAEAAPALSGDRAVGAGRRDSTTTRGESLVTIWQLLFSYDGRISRGQFWLGYALILVLFIVILAVSIWTVTLDLIGSGLLWIPGVVSGVVLGIWCQYAVCAKRLHDLNRTGWFGATQLDTLCRRDCSADLVWSVPWVAGRQ